MLSLRIKKDGEKLYHKLKDRKILVDFRMPGNIRVTPAPLYNSFSDVYQFIEVMKELL